SHKKKRVLQENERLTSDTPFTLGMLCSSLSLSLLQKKNDDDLRATLTTTMTTTGQSEQKNRAIPQKQDSTRLHDRKQKHGELRGSGRHSVPRRAYIRAKTGTALNTKNVH
ncbi:unnamed protein product, partial [Ectocarpus sp. 12 AP-2014]